MRSQMHMDGIKRRICYRTSGYTLYWEIFSPNMKINNQTWIEV